MLLLWQLSTPSTYMQFFTQQKSINGSLSPKGSQLNNAKETEVDYSTTKQCVLPGNSPW